MTVTRSMFNTALTEQLTKLTRDCTWQMEREAAYNATRIGFHCRATAWIAISDLVIEDARDPGRFVFDEAMRLYNQRHTPLHPTIEHDYTPVLECPSCHSAVSVPDAHRMSLAELYEYSEAQSVRWAERAAMLKG